MTDSLVNRLFLCLIMTLLVQNGLDFVLIALVRLLIPATSFGLFQFLLLALLKLSLASRV